jgi:hypothetical protein
MRISESWRLAKHRNRNSKQKSSTRHAAEKEVSARRADFAHGQRLAKRASSPEVVLRLMRRDLSSPGRRMDVLGVTPVDWIRFLHRLTQSRGARRCASWWRNWLVGLDTKTCSVDDYMYSAYHIETTVNLSALLLSPPEQLFEWHRERAEQRALVSEVRAALVQAYDGCKQLHFYFEGARKTKPYSDNPLRDSVGQCIETLDRRASLLGYLGPAPLTMGKRGRAASDRRAAVRGYLVRLLAKNLSVLPSGIRDELLVSILEAAGHGTRATRQNVQALLRSTVVIR